MAIFSFSANSWTATATADTTALANNTYMAINGGSTTVMHKHSEIYMGGEASASSLNIMNFARSSTISATPGALAAKQSLASANPAGINTTAIANVTAGTPPQRDVNRHLLNLSFNSFGGIVRWVAAPGSEIITIGNVAATATTGGEVTLSGFTGATSGAMSAHVLFEQLHAPELPNVNDSINAVLRPRYNHRALGAKTRLGRRSDEWRGLTI